MIRKSFETVTIRFPAVESLRSRWGNIRGTWAAREVGFIGRRRGGLVNKVESKNLFLIGALSDVQ